METPGLLKTYLNLDSTSFHLKCVNDGTRLPPMIRHSGCLIACAKLNFACSRSSIKIGSAVGLHLDYELGCKVQNDTIS